MLKRVLAGTLSTALLLGVLAALPLSAAHAADTTVRVGPESLLTGSTGILLTKQYETVDPIAGYRSGASANFVTAPGAINGTALQLSTGTPPGAFPTKYGKDYVGHNFPVSTAATALTGFDFTTLSFQSTDPSPYLSVEYYNAAADPGQQYVNLTWTPGVTAGVANAGVEGGTWQSWDTSTGWRTTAGFITGITPNTAISLANAGAAIQADTPTNQLQLIRANVSFGDTVGNYNDKSVLLDQLAFTTAAGRTIYSFDAPYTSTCSAGTSGSVGGAQLNDTSQWQVRTEYEPTVNSSAKATLGSGPIGATTGSSLTLSTGAGTTALGRGYAGKVFVDKQLAGCTVGDLTDLGYRTYTAAGQSGLAPYLNLEVTEPATTTSSAQTAILIWSPSLGEMTTPVPVPVVDGWSTWSPLTTGSWRVVGTIGALVSGQQYAWSDVATAIGTASLQRGIEIVAGDSTYQSTAGAGWSGKSVQVDSLTVGVNGASATYAFGGDHATTVIDAAALASHTDGFESFKERDWTNGATSAFVGGPSGAVGNSSLELRLGAARPSDNDKIYTGQTTNAVPLTQLTALSYRVRTDGTNATTQQPYVQVIVEGNTVGYASLVFDPSIAASYAPTAGIANGTWNTFNVLGPDSKFRNSRAIGGVAAGTYKTLAEWLATDPGLRTHSTVGGIYVVAGAQSGTAAWSDYRAQLNVLTIGYSGDARDYAFRLSAPGAVTGIVASAVTGTGFDLGWAASAGATSYDVTVNGTTTAVSGTTTSIAGLTPGTAYVATVTAKNVAGTSTPQSIAVVTTPTPVAQVPAALTGLTATAVTTSGFDLSWATSAGATSYDVTVGTTPTNVVGTNTNVTGLASGTAYLVTVTPRNAVGINIPQSLLVKTATVVTPPSVKSSTLVVTHKPVQYGSVVKASGVVKLNNAGAGGHVVTLSRKAGATWVKVANVTTAANGTWKTSFKASFPTTSLRATTSGYPTAVAKLTVASKATIKVSKRTVKVTVSPKLTGKRVYLQIKAGKKWNTVKRATLASGSTKTFKADKKGTYRVVVPAAAGYAWGVSNTANVR